MKGKLIFGTAVAAAGLALTLVSCGPRFGERGCMRHHERFLERKVSQIESDLSLTDAQKAKFKELRGRVKSDILAGLNERKQVLALVREKVKGDTANVDEIVAIVRTQMRKNHGKMEEKIGYISEFYNMLTPEQKRIFTRKVREHLDKRDDRMDGFIDRLQKLDI